MTASDSSTSIPASAPGLSPSASFGYVPALDGLRAVAIVVVMAYHAFPKQVHGGFLGVELFFVLSGFLITALLLKEWDRFGSISLPNFYMRRVIRLFPALVLLLIVVLWIDSLVFADVVGRETGRDALLSLAYVMNWARAFDWVTTSFLAHTWSLSIEEQFYLLWPAMLVLLCRRCDARQIAVRLTVLAVLIALYRASATLAGAAPLRMYNGLDTRADGLMLGSALAAAFQGGLIDVRSKEVQQQFRRLVPVASFGLAFAVFLADWRFARTYLFLLPITVLLSSVLIGGVYVSAAGSPVRRFLESRTLVGIGRISYGLYLWHFPIYQMLGQLGWSRPATAIVGTPLSVLIAVLSFRYLEQPILSWKRRFAPEAAHQKTTSPTVVKA